MTRIKASEAGVRSARAGLRFALVMSVVAGLWLGAVGAPAGATAATRKPAKNSLIAKAAVAEVGVYSEPNAPQPTQVFANPTKTDGQLVFLVDDAQAGWLKVLLPVRPNGATGWIKATDVYVITNPYRITVELGAHKLILRKKNKVMLDEPAGIGKGTTPTPGGRYYITQLFEPPDPKGAYGPFAYSLSGFSDVLTSFQGGEAIIGIHGTNHPELVGQDVSSGCIRVKNDVIERLAKILPLGTPVQIQK